LQISADMHTHTIASTHAFSTILENSVCAKEIGLKALAITDHEPNMLDAPHIWHFENLSTIPRILNDVIIIRGVEANIIDSEGNIDMPKCTLEKMEWVVASMHSPCIEKGTVEENTKRYMGICKNPYVDVIGHPTTNEYPWDYEKGLKYIKEYDKIIEINESSINVRAGALENAVEMLKVCKRLEIPITLDSDAHFCQRIGVTTSAVKLIEELEYPKELIINLDWEILKERILKKHPSALK